MESAVSRVDPRLIKESGEAIAEARQFKITSIVAYEGAGDRLQSLKGLMKKVDEAFNENIKKAHDLHKSLLAEKAKHMQPLQQAETAIKTAMLRWRLEEETRRRQEQARLEEEARKEREKLEARAAKAAEKGKEEKAAELRVQAQTVATPVLATTTPKLQGISTRETYKATVTSKAKLIEACAGGRRVIGDPNYQGPERRVHPKVQDAVLNYDQAVLNQLSRALKTELAYPGVRVELVQSIASKAA